MNVEELSPEQLDALAVKVINRKTNLAIQTATEALDEAKKANEQIRNVKNEMEEQIEVAKNSMRVNAPRYDWVNQSKFGEFLEPSIGSKTLGKLLKVVGLAKKNTARTTPYRKYIGENKYARIRTFEHYSTTDWNYEKCLDYIDDWLEEQGHDKEFYSTENEEDRKEFIDQLYEEYVD